jgi:26S proteasome regulatory subunit N5
MERREKAEFLLEQMRLCLDKQDYVRAELVSNKISKKMMAELEFQVLCHFCLFSLFSFVFFSLFSKMFFTVFVIDCFLFFQDLKVRWENLQIRLFLPSSRYLDICKCYRSIYDTPSILADPAKWKEVYSFLLSVLAFFAFLIFFGVFAGTSICCHLLSSFSI